MPEQRGRQYHRGRLAEALREEISVIIEGELEDPRIGLVTVSEVALAPDGRSAQVFVAIAGSEDESAESLEGLVAARNYIRHLVAERLRLRAAPELYFRLDNSLQHQTRIDELLKRLNRKRKA